jgi:hypothetical protein
MKRCEDKSFAAGVVTFALPLFLLLTSGTGLAQGPSSPEKPLTPVFWFTVVVVTIFLVVFMLSLIRGLMSSKEWSLADAVSEETDPQPPLASGQKPIMVASSSRLIALLGLFVILSLFLGVGYYILWCLFTNCQMTSLKDVTSYFYAGLVLFAPYIANKFSDAFSIFKPTK